MSATPVATLDWQSWLRALGLGGFCVGLFVGIFPFLVASTADQSVELMASLPMGGTIAFAALIGFVIGNN
jgi:hypothetical protein